MKHILLLFTVLLVGCAVPTDQLHKNAMGCGKELIIEPNGIVRRPTEQEKEEQCKPLWSAYNKRLEAIAKREEERKDSSCGKGMVSWCNVRIGSKNCGCVKRSEARRALERMQSDW